MSAARRSRLEDLAAMPARQGAADRRRSRNQDDRARALRRRAPRRHAAAYARARAISRDDAEALRRADRASSKSFALIVGLPLDMDGEEGPRAQATRAFARNFARLDPTPFAFWDERMSTAAVERALIANDVSRARRAEVIDKMAAAYILQGALDRLARLARGRDGGESAALTPRATFVRVNDRTCNRRDR